MSLVAARIFDNLHEPTLNSGPAEHILRIDERQCHRPVTLHVPEPINEVRATLRIEWEDFNANSWHDELHPADVIEKHLARAARAEIRRLRSQVIRLGGTPE